MRRPAFLMLALVALLALPACTSTSMSPPETFTLAAQKVEFQPPPSTWSKNVQEIPKSWDMGAQAPGQEAKLRELPGGTMVRFTPPWPGAHLTLSALGGWGMKSWAEDPEKTKAHVSHLQEQVIKRTDGRITAQPEATLGGETAFRMEFQYQDGVRQMKGIQVHALHQGTYWSVALLCPAENYREGAATFDALVKGFKFL